MLTGTLTNAGTMTVSHEEGRTGVFIECSPEMLRAQAKLPMYQPVTVIATAELASLREDKARLDWLSANKGAVATAILRATHPEKFTVSPRTKTSMPLTPQEEIERSKHWAIAVWAASSYQAAYRKAELVQAERKETGHPPVSYPMLADFIATAILRATHPEKFTV